MSKERPETCKNCGAPEVWCTCEVKPCPFCGKTETAIDGVVRHTNGNCPAWGIYSVELWNTRSIEDALNKRITELETENSRLLSAITEIYELTREFSYDRTLLQIKKIVDKITGGKNE